MSLLLATCGESVAADTFNMVRRQTLWPQLATAESGTWAWAGSASKEFGGAYENSSAASGDYVEFANVPLFGANAKVNFLYTKSSNGGIIKVYWNGDQLGTLDTYNGSTTYNNVSTVDLGTVSANRGTLRLISDTKNASSSAYKISVQQVEVVQLTGTATGSSLDDLPWVVDVPPVSYDSTNYTPVLTQNTVQAWGGDVQITDNQNDYTEWKVWLPQGTHELKIAHKTGSDNAIGTVSLNGATIGTYNPYALSGLNNQIATISSISVASTGVHTLRITAATRDGSSTGWDLHINWLQFRKTTTTGAITATGATYGRETLELWPWFADDTNYNGFLITASSVYYGAFYKTTKAINQYQEWEHSLLPGTYSLADMVVSGAADHGVGYWTEDGGSTLDTIDYSSDPGYNKILTASVALAGGALRVSIDSTNTTNYGNTRNFVRLTRTGA